MQVLQVVLVLQVRHSGRHLLHSYSPVFEKYPLGQLDETHFRVSVIRYFNDWHLSQVKLFEHVLHPEMHGLHSFSALAKKLS